MSEPSLHHVFPSDEGDRHDLEDDGCSCPCGPRVFSPCPGCGGSGEVSPFRGDGIVVVHQVLDDVPGTDFGRLVTGLAVIRRVAEERGRSVDGQVCAFPRGGELVVFVATGLPRADNVRLRRLGWTDREIDTGGVEWSFEP